QDCPRSLPLADAPTRHAWLRNESIVTAARATASALRRPRIIARCAPSEVDKAHARGRVTSRATNEVGKRGQVEKWWCSELLWQCARVVQVPADLLESVPRNLVEERAQTHSQTRRRLPTIPTRCRQRLRDRRALSGVEGIAQGRGGSIR